MAKREGQSPRHAHIGAGTSTHTAGPGAIGTPHPQHMGTHSSIPTQRLHLTPHLPPPRPCLVSPSSLLCLTSPHRLASPVRALAHFSHKADSQSKGPQSLVAHTRPSHQKESQRNRSTAQSGTRSFEELQEDRRGACGWTVGEIRTERKTQAWTPGIFPKEPNGIKILTNPERRWGSSGYRILSQVVL